MDLLLRTIAIFLVGDEIIPTVVLHEPLWCHLVQLPGLSQVVSFYVLRVEIVLHDIPVPVSILTLSLQGLQILNHAWIINLVGDGIVKVRMSSLVARRDLVLSPQMHLDLPCIVAVFRLFFIRWIIELLRNRVEAI